MKKIICIGIFCALLLCTAGCCCINLDVKEPASAETTIPDTEPILATEPAVITAPAATEPVQTEPPETEPEPTEPPSFLSYTTQLSASACIYEGPGLDTGFVQNVCITGIYTILEEAFDADGNLWGRLKSGLGWVLLQVNTDGGRQVCVRCGTTQETAFLDSWVPGELCMGCTRYLAHYGEGGGIYCSQCHKDVSYLGVLEDGRCEFCHDED